MADDRHTPPPLVYSRFAPSNRGAKKDKEKAPPAPKPGKAKPGRLAGELSACPLADLLPKLVERQGALALTRLAEGDCVLHLADGCITHLEGSSLAARDPWSLRQRLYSLIITARQGHYSFVDLPAEQVLVRVQWPIERVLIAATTQALILEESGPWLPDPAAIFQLTGKDPEALDNESLRRRLQTLTPLLDGRRSVGEIARWLDIDEIDVRYTLAHLSSSGHVRPVVPVPAETALSWGTA